MATTVRVKPSSRIGPNLPPAVLLSTFDMLMPSVYVPLRMIFRPSASTSPPIQYHALNLITAYAEVLAYFPLLAGSILPDESGSLYVHSDNRGADFVYEIRKQKFPGKHAEDLAPRSVFPNPNNKDEALLAVKLTSFSCGSHVLVLSFFHTLIDLASAMDFVRAFANQAIGQPLTTVPKQWMRNPLEYFPEACALSEMPGYTILPPGLSCSPPPPPGPAEQVVMHISMQNLAKLKSTLGLTVSAFHLLTAVLWRASTTYCVTDLGDAEFLYLAIAANGRERSPTKIMSREHYFGNFITDVTASMKKSELLAKDGLSSVASSVQAAIQEQLTAEYMARRVKTLETVSFNRLIPHHRSKLTSWPMEDTLDLHFGLTNPGEGQVTLLPGKDLHLPVGVIHVMKLSDDMYRVQFSIPVGKGAELRMHEELQNLVELVDDD